MDGQKNTENYRSDSSDKADTQRLRNLINIEVILLTRSRTNKLQQSRGISILGEKFFVNGFNVIMSILINTRQMKPISRNPTKKKTELS